MSRGYRSSPYMAIRLGGRGDIASTHVDWRVPTGAPYVSSLLHYQGVIYMGGENGILSAVDAANGQRLWQERVGGVFTASPIAGDGKVYFVSEAGETVVLKAGRTFESVAQPGGWPFCGVAGGGWGKLSCVRRSALRRRRADGAKSKAGARDQGSAIRGQGRVRDRRVRSQGSRVQVEKGWRHVVSTCRDSAGVGLWS